jgi:hypothetical protein
MSSSLRLACRWSVCHTFVVNPLDIRRAAARVPPLVQDVCGEGFAEQPPDIP